MHQPILTIAIPTFNRSAFLQKALTQLFLEIDSVDESLIEVIVSDNASTDNTQEVVKAYVDHGRKINYVRNEQNLGPDINFANSFAMAKGKYVLLLGDDDFLIKDSLKHIISHLSKQEVGVLCMKAYGFGHNESFQDKLPSSVGRAVLFDNVGDFLSTIGDLMTLISSCIVNKSILSHIKPHEYCNTNLIHVNLVLYASLTAKLNLYIDQYLVACTRNNSGGYNFWAVFVTNLGFIFDKFEHLGLSKHDRQKIDKHFIISFYPYYLLKTRLNNSYNLDEVIEKFDFRFQSLLYKVWIKPTLLLPKHFAIVWGVFTTLIGRLMYGDADKLVSYSKAKLKSAFN